MTAPQVDYLQALAVATELARDQARILLALERACEVEEAATVEYFGEGMRSYAALTTIEIRRILAGEVPE